jgi:hypothetical protein
MLKSPKAEIESETSSTDTAINFIDNAIKRLTIISITVDDPPPDRYVEKLRHDNNECLRYDN